MQKKVLIIEDSKLDADIEVSLLKDFGIDAVTAETGAAGIEKALTYKPDLILLDLMLPDINGLEVCQRLKKEICLKHTIVLVVSSKDKIDEITKAFQAGADDYIIKPPMPEFMARKVKLYLGIKDEAATQGEP